MRQTDGRIRVLYVAPEASRDETVGHLRRDERFEVLTEPDASSGLDRLATTTVDCVVSDYDLPERDGIAFLNAVRERDETLPFVLYTASGSEAVASRAIAAGVSDYVRRRPETESSTELAERVKTVVDSTPGQADHEAESATALLAALAEMVCVVANGRISYVNQGGVDLLGVDDDTELVGREFRETVSLADRPVVERTLREVESGGSPQSQRVRWHVADTAGAEDTYVEAAIRPITWNDERASLVVGHDLGRDTGVGRGRDRAVSKYEQILERLDAVVWLADKAFEETLYMNQATIDWYGKSHEELQRDESAYLECMHPDDRMTEIALLKEISEAATNDDVEVEDMYTSEFRLLVDGTVRWVEELTFPIRDENGEVYLWAGIEYDITEQKQIQHELTETKLRYEQILELLESVVYLTDLSYDEVLYVNEAYETVYQQSLDEFSDNPGSYRSKIHPDDLASSDGFTETIHRLASAGVEPANRYDNEFRLLRDDGEVRWIHETVFPVLNSDNVPIRWAGIETDVTEQKQRENELERLNDRLEFQNTVLSVMNRVLRHDLRNKLSIIKGTTTTLAEGSGDDPLIDALVDATDKILAKASQARTIERLCEQYERRASVDVASTIREYTDRLASTYPDAEVSVAVEESSYVTAHPLVETALENILENALEHNDSTDPRMDVVVTRTTRDGQPYLDVEVTDNGPGIPRLEQEVLQRDHETQLDHSMGLGLWFTQWVMELSDGILDIVDRDERGTTVRMSLPVATDSEHRRDDEPSPETEVRHETGA